MAATPPVTGQLDKPPTGPLFPAPEALDYTDVEEAEIARVLVNMYRQRVQDQRTRTTEHKRFDQMFRGRVKDFNERTGPWPDSANLHVQVPYWLVDAIEARLNHIVWSQNPLVSGRWEDPTDQARMERAARLCEWNFLPRRMNMRPLWSRASKIRLIHGMSTTLFSYANVDHKYRIALPKETEEDYQFVGGQVMVDDDDNPIKLPTGQEVSLVTGKKYQGPVAYPYEWDDVQKPDGCMNLQPNSDANPGGADYVFLRGYELLHRMFKQANPEGRYHSMFSGDLATKAAWENAAPTSPPGVSGDENEERLKQQQQMDGQQAQQVAVRKGDKRNPSVQTLMYFGQWEHPKTKEDEEVVFFLSVRPVMYLGGYLLTDLLYTGDRPIMEMHYQTVSNTINSMGVCEIVQHLSDELDTIHNMRVDVGFATNMPWYFVRNTSGIRASNITISPLALIQVDDPRDVVAPQVQNVTSFYHEEETLLLTIIERVMGIADLFLGINVRGGAAARHATGFQGQREESEARMANPIAQDAESFSFMCRTVNALELMYGPDERRFRLTGELGEGTTHNVSRSDLFYQDDYDFSLGANLGMYSQQYRHQRAQSEYEGFMQNPLVAQDLGRVWEFSAEILRSSGRSEAEIALRIGPKSALPMGEQMTPEQAINEIVQGKYGLGGFPMPHPNDDNPLFIKEATDFSQSRAFMAMATPEVTRALMNFIGEHRQAMEMKMQQQQMMQMQPPQGAPPGGGANNQTTQDRAQAGMAGAGGAGGAPNMGTFAGQAQNGTGGGPPLPPPPMGV
jgi:hypothetical protein